MSATTPNHWKLGLFVVVGVLIGVGALFWIGANRFDKEIVPVVSYFDESVQGVEQGSPVKFRGVTIGTVHDITLGSDRFHVQVTFHVYKEKLRRLGLPDRSAEEWGVGEFVPCTLRCQIVSTGITGMKILQVDFFDAKTHPVPVFAPGPYGTIEPPWNYLPSTPSSLKTIEEGLTNSLDRMPLVLEEIHGLTKRVSGVMDDLARSEVPARAGNLLGAAERKVLEFDSAGISGKAGTVLDRAEDLITHLEKAVADARVGGTAESLRSASASIEGAASDIGALAVHARDELRSLRRTLESVRALAELLERDPGALLHGRSPAAQPPGVR